MNHLLEIETNKSLYYNNVAYFRKKINNSILNDELNIFMNYLRTNNFVLLGPLISVTYSVQTNGSDTIIDIEYMVPLERPIIDHSIYRTKPIFHLVNAIKASISDPNSESIKFVYDKINNYIQSNNLQQITYFYNVSNLDSVSKSNFMDVYVGINPSIL